MRDYCPLYGTYYNFEFDMVISGIKKHTGAPISVLLSGMFPADYKRKTICTVLSYTCFEFELSENNERSINHPNNQLTQF